MWLHGETLQGQNRLKHVNGIDCCVPCGPPTRWTMTVQYGAILNMCLYRLLCHTQIPYQVDIVRGCVDNDSIGALVCRRAEGIDAVAVVMAKHSRGTIK